MRLSYASDPSLNPSAIIPQLPHGILWVLEERVTIHNLGPLPFWVNPSSDQPFFAQIDVQYPYGGGWREVPGFIVEGEGFDTTLTYPGDPAHSPIAIAYVHSVPRVFIFPYAWVMTRERDGSTHIARID